MNTHLLKRSNSDDEGLPLRLDLGGTRQIDKPYDKPKWKLVYVPSEGAVFVPAETKVQVKQPGDFFN